MSLVGNFGVLFAQLAIGYDFVWCIVPFGHMIMWKSGLRKILLYKKTQQIEGLQRYQNPAIEVLKIFFQLVYASISLHPLSLVWTICMVHTNLPCSVSTFYFRFRSWIYYYCHANWTSDLKLESIGKHLLPTLKNWIWVSTNGCCLGLKWVTPTYIGIGAPMQLKKWLRMRR